MTIFDAGYSGIEYRPVGMLGRLWCLTWMEFTQLFRTRKGLLVFLACIALLVVKAVVMWGQLSAETDAMARAASMVSPAWSPFRVEFYMSHSTQFGFLPFLVLTTLIGVRAIAGDKETNALEIYWTRGISPWGYFAGKWAGSALLLGAAFFVGPLVLWVYGLLAAPDGTFASTTTPFMPKVLGALLLKSVVVS
ncbi:MAG: hypothetical protein H6836_06640, partial [Planctomycetes bacterium]|nr:hypothetical protein [Planctomycetota bacterium]